MTLTVITILCRSDIAMRGEERDGSYLSSFLCCECRWVGWVPVLEIVEGKEKQRGCKKISCIVKAEQA
jgi:hypothetical protein